MPLKHAESIRERVARGFVRPIGDLRIFVSGTEGNTEAVEQLRPPASEILLAKLIDTVLEHLGNPPPATPASSAGSATRRVVRRLLGE